MENINRGQYWGTQTNKSSTKWIEETQALFIDNRYRSSGSNVDYVIDFNNNNGVNSSFNVMKNVTSVELKGIQGDFEKNQYIILDIKELNNRLVSNVPIANQSFCVIYCHNDFRGNQFIKGNDFDTKKINFNPPLSSLSRLEIKLKKADGTDGTDVFINDPGMVTMIFEITVAKNVIY